MTEPTEEQRAALLAALKASLLQAIDFAALMALGDVDGLDAVRAEKAREVERLDLSAVPRPGDFPLCARRVGKDGADLQEVADGVRAARAEWLAHVAVVEDVRLDAKAAVRRATTEAEVQAVWDGLGWPERGDG